jgi:hypothetical protein
MGSWLHEYHDVHVLTDSSIHLLPEVYVSDGAVRWCDGGRLPRETIYRYQLSSIHETLLQLTMQDTD